MKTRRKCMFSYRDKSASAEFAQSVILQDCFLIAIVAEPCKESVNSAMLQMLVISFANTIPIPDVYSVQRCCYHFQVVL
jgi:hypothetical protein